MRREEKNRKIEYLWKDSEKTKQEILKEIANSERIKNNIINIPLEKINVIRTYSTDWEEVSRRAPGHPNEDLYYRKQWRIIIERFPEKYISFINCIPLYEYPVENYYPYNTNTGAYRQEQIGKIPYLWGDVSVMYIIQDIPNEEDMKRLELIAYCDLADWSYEPKLEKIRTKLLIQFYNPDVFI